MKKLTTAVTRKGVEKRIEVLIEDEIAYFLEENVDEASRHKFIVEEYKAQRIERKETRRHRSLERLQEKGLDREELAANFEIAAMEKLNLHNAVQQLTTAQRFVVEQYYFKDVKIKDIANRAGVSFQAVAQMLCRAKVKLKKFLKNF